jgi:hypothetical protein
MIHSESRASGRGAGRVGKPTNRNRGGKSNAMEIDSVGAGSSGGSDRRGGHAQRGGRSAAKRRGGNRQGASRKPMSKDALDNDLDNYMMKDASVAKARLDQEIESYQQARAH